MNEDRRESLETVDEVGYGSLPQQYVNHLLMDAFVFNIMVVGRSGIGKTTLLNSLFKTQFPVDENPGSKELNVQVHELQEEETKLKLTTVETRGLEDEIDRSNCYENIIQYIDIQMENYFQEESKIIRTFNDTRIHCCLYLIPPDGLRKIDLIIMEKLHNKVNLIPIIAKADSITPQALCKYRTFVKSEIIQANIAVYEFPTKGKKMADFNHEMNELLPLAVVASNDFVEVNGTQERAIQYPWGIVQVEKTDHSNLSLLRKAILSVNMPNLIHTTHVKLYEFYRKARLQDENAWVKQSIESQYHQPLRDEEAVVKLQGIRQCSIL